MAKRNNPEQLDLFPESFPVQMTQEWFTKLIRLAEERGRKDAIDSMHPVCVHTGCKQETHFEAIRELQKINGHLEKYATHYDNCLAARGNEECTCGYIKR